MYASSAEQIIFSLEISRSEPLYVTDKPLTVFGESNEMLMSFLPLADSFPVMFIFLYSHLKSAINEDFGERFSCTSSHPVMTKTGITKRTHNAIKIFRAIRHLPIHYMSCEFFNTLYK
jgi:hypothetical protein